ncbi:uncharacterized protein C12orf56 homolog isoform X2 [Hypanus sabinus]|uniref:uncharacterized protein C12orf56 homolog isoform X2 n=1 Tax=Hypanus sabinus TaxID=79690 RepID=UPI0028C40EB4|nr:uncharacterized protein C12orf56 homolog isoform X2 [Hypanus sabinus]
MARNELDPFPFKRHDKLDFFLKRHLDESVFNKIRMYEACIVVTEKKHKKAFHFVILTDECIYLTQNPPKSIHEAVHLGDVVAIELVNDYPEFLSGRDRESAQHIRISYVAQTAKEQQSTAVSSKYRPARISGRRKFGLEEVETNQEALSSPGKLNSKQIKPLRESSLRKGAAFAGEPNPRVTCAVPRPPPDLKNLKLSEKRKEERPAPSSASARPLPVPPRDRPAGGLASAENPAPVELLPANRCLSQQKEQQLDVCDSIPDAEKRINSQSVERELELHLYIISMSSLIFLHLKSAWNNFMISTLMQDPAYAQVSASASPARGPKAHNSEGINKLFNQLSSELLYGSSTSERTCSLLQELKATALRSFTIKKLFWKSNDLYPFLVEKLQQHLPSLQDSSRQQDQRKTKEDLQFCILIVETLGVMFRETETEPTRLELLNAERGLLVVNLLKILICGPQVSKACAAVGDGTPFGCVIAAAPQSEELQKLLLEYNDAVVSALYEIFLITHQGSWGSGSGNVMTVGWLMAALQRLPAMLLFIDHMMKRIIETVLSPLHLMSPSQALLLFQQLYILNTCLQYGSRLAEHIRSKYCEEFRYYIQKATVEAMLPVHYAVSQPAVRLLQQVLGCILQKPV